MGWADQTGYTVRCEWGEDGVLYFAPLSDVLIIVDVMSFSSCVSIAVKNGVMVHPFGERGDTAHAYADQHNALLATRENGYLLRPANLQTLTSGTSFVLPSPNGSKLTTLAGDAQNVFAGCLRNAKTVAQEAQKHGDKVTVIPAGERWKDSRRLRPAIEDLIGAGAIIHHLSGEKSPEARIAESAYLAVKNDIVATLRACASGQELLERGRDEDVNLILSVNVDDVAPRLIDDAYYHTG